MVRRKGRRFLVEGKVETLRKAEFDHLEV